MLSEIENAILTKLTESATEVRLKAKVDSYGGQIDDAALDDLAQGGPQVWAVVTGANRRRERHDGSEYAVNFSIICSAGSTEDGAARHGSRGGLIVGAYDLVRYVTTALNGFKAKDLFLQPLEHSSVTNLFSAKVNRAHLAIYSVQFSARVHWKQEDLSDLDDLETIQHATTPNLSDAADPIDIDLPQKEPGA